MKSRTQTNARKNAQKNAQTRARTNLYLTRENDPVDSRTKFVISALQEGIQDALYKFFFPDLLSSSWDLAVSEIPSIRYDLHIKGTETLQVSLFLAFLEVTGGLPAGSFTASFEALLECLLHKDVLLALLSELVHSDGDPIATDNSSVRSAFMVSVGALWEETRTLDRVQEWVFTIFNPLIRIAIKTYNEFGPGEMGSAVKEATVCNVERKRGGGEVTVLRRMRAYQLARKPVKPRARKLRDRDMTSVSDDEDEYSTEEDEEEETPTCNDEENLTSSSAVTATPPRPGKGKSAPWDGGFVWRQAIQDGVLLEPFVLKAKKRRIEDDEENGILEAFPCKSPARSPLGPRNPAGSSPDAGRTFIFPGSSPTGGYQVPPSSSPCGNPSSPSPLVLSLKENMAL
ncbi:hypothetical protein MVEN_01485800 [Mycena venus]|uniref:Uncharacterized protein n=1 Tax=Mycena venus TaxID=2733690 RepID=A0A8H7CR86_9AGAR|nr:hypothetical protein MVEN_01485800 [Mycena venus]